MITQELVWSLAVLLYQTLFDEIANLKLFYFGGARLDLESFSWLISKMKNVVKTLLGYKLYFSSQDCFSRNFFAVLDDKVSVSYDILAWEIDLDQVTNLELLEIFMKFFHKHVEIFFI